MRVQETILPKTTTLPEKRFVMQRTMQKKRTDSTPEDFGECPQGAGRDTQEGGHLRRGLAVFGGHKVQGTLKASVGVGGSVFYLVVWLE